jgi:O-antigen ligase
MSRLSRLIIAYIVAIPLALVLGCLVATPGMASIVALGFVLCCLAAPLVIQWHHALLILGWNSAFILGFMPGQPRIWLVLAAVSFSIGALNHVLGFKSFLRAPELTKPLLFLLGVILVTAWFRGGIGTRVFGGAGFGGRNYAYVLGAFMGYFALTAQRIPPEKGPRMTKWFFLSAITNAIPNVTYLLGPSFYFLYILVSADSAVSQAQSDWEQNGLSRLGDFSNAAIGLMCFMLAHWGIRGIFEWHKPWRLLLLAVTVTGGLLSGFRSQFTLMVAVFVIQFVVEGLWKTAFLPLFCLLGLLCVGPVLLFANKMPSAMQRCLAFLPVDINPDVRADAQASIDWRVDLWKAAWPEVPKYLFVGKGYSLDPLDTDMTTQAARMGLVPSYEEALYAGNYHNGLLSILIPFGLLGTIAFVWLLVAGVKVLYCNYRYGDARLRMVNTTLFSFFLTQSLFFFIVFGAFNVQIVVFLGTLGMSVSLNNGVCRKEVPKTVRIASAPALALEPA